jgi:spore maturation protein CgeB
MARTLGVSEPVRVAIADDSGLIFSDDYRLGWEVGFRSIGCEVETFDIRVLRQLGIGSLSPYRSRAMPGTAKALAEQIVKWKPHLVWCHHGRAASNGDFLGRLHKEGIKSAVYLCDEPYEVGETARYSPSFRHVFTMDPCTLDVHRRSRRDRDNVFYLPPCADPFRFQYRTYENRSVSALFLGNATLVPRLDWLKPIDRLVDGADIRFFKSVGKGHPKWVSAEDHPDLYSSCIVGLNVHRDPAITLDCFKKRVLGRSKHMQIPLGLELCKQMPAKEGTGFWNDGNLPSAHVNPRFFEMASSGACVVSDAHRPELARMFPMAPRASDPDHFVELVMHYIKHQDEAEKIGAACSYLISKRHSYRHRAAEVLIRVGLRGLDRDSQHSFLGEPGDWLTPQDFERLKESWSSVAIGRSERWSPAYGTSLTRMSGSPSESDSLDVLTPWLS